MVNDSECYHYHHNAPQFTTKRSHPFYILFPPPRVPSAMKSLTTNCSGFGGLVNEDNEHYCAGWELPTERTKNSKACRKGEFR